MFSRLSAIRRRLSRAREWFPLTNLGVVISALSAAAYWGFGVPRSDYVVQVVAALAMALVLTAVIAVVIGALLVRSATARTSSTPIVFEARRGFAEAFSLPVWWGLPLFDVTWTWLEPEGFRLSVVKSNGRRFERVETERRGHVQRIVRRLVVEDGFGLARLALHRTEDRPLTVVPWAGALDRAPLLRSLAAGDALPHPRGALVGDPVDMRRYAPGDPLKLAMWKVYARTQQLMVRTPERSIAPSSQVAAYLPAAAADEPPAAAARLAVESGVLGPEWIFGADGSPTPVRDPESARQQIVEARHHRFRETGQAAGLAGFVDQFDHPESIRLVLFVPGRPGTWLETVVEVAMTRTDQTTCVVVVDGVQPLAAPPRWSRWLKRPQPPKDEEEAVVTPDELQTVVQTLQRAGLQVDVLDRVRGVSINGMSGGEAAAVRRVA
ncbi:MAG: DUF58 domain-containing protein [Myxococcota bacterium]